MEKIPFDITFHPSWYHKHAGISFGRRFFEDAAFRVACDREMRRTLYDHFGEYGIGEKDPKPRPVLGSDLLACGYLHSAILGCDIRYTDDNAPEVICKNMDEAAVRELQLPDLRCAPLWQNQEEQIAFLLREYGYVIPAVNLMGIQNIAIDLRGTELFFDYAEEPELAERLLAVCTELSIAIGKRYEKLSSYLSGGVTSIVRKTCPQVYLTSNCTEELISNEVYEEFLLKYDNRLAEAFPNFGIHHCGQSMEHIVRGYRKVKNLKFAEVGAFSDLTAVRQTLPEVFLNARYSPVRLKEVSAQTVREEVDRIYAAGAPLSLLSVSCVGIDSGTTDEQIKFFLSACHDR